MAFASYATVTEFKDKWATLSDSLDDDVIQDVLDSTSRWVDEYCARHFWQDGSAGGGEVARTFAACHQRAVDLYSFADLVSVSELATDESGDGTYGTVWTSADYQLQPVNRPTGRPYTRIEAVAGRLFPIRHAAGTRPDRVRVTGVWGWPAVPEPVKTACLIQSFRILKRRYSPEGVAGPSEFGVFRVSRQDPDVMSLLEPYRRTAVLVA